MFFDQQRDALRRLYFDAWQQYQDKQALDPLQQQIAQVIQDHSEYHKIFSDPDKHLDKDYLAEFGETNPFLHMGLHLSLREQINTNRPKGITETYQAYLKQNAGDRHTAEHQMIDILAACLWQAQRDGKAPDEADFIRQLQAKLFLLS